MALRSRRDIRHTQREAPLRGNVAVGKPAVTSDRSAARARVFDANSSKLSPARCQGGAAPGDVLAGVGGRGGPSEAGTAATSVTWPPCPVARRQQEGRLRTVRAPEERRDRQSVRSRAQGAAAFFRDWAAPDNPWNRSSQVRWPQVQTIRHVFLARGGGANQTTPALARTLPVLALCSSASPRGREPPVPSQPGDGFRGQAAARPR